jgi:hypothetical protein
VFVVALCKEFGLFWNLSPRFRLLALFWFLACVILGSQGGCQKNGALSSRVRSWFRPQLSMADNWKRLTTNGGPVDSKRVCHKLRDSTFHGAFRELDCLITLRRAFPTQGRPLEKEIFHKLRALFKRLKEKSNDWRTVARWKRLYQLTTRLYPLRNVWAKSAKIPVYEVNGHHLSVPFWIRESQRRDVGTLFHLDTHNDMRAVLRPKDVLKAVSDIKAGRKVKSAWHTIAHSIYDCAMPVAGGVLTVKYKRVIWGKPSWNGYVEFVNRNFFFGIPKQARDVFVIPPGTKGKTLERLEKKKAKLMKKHDHFRLFYDPKMDNNRSRPKGDAWLQIQKSQRPLKQKFTNISPFLFSILTTDLAIDARGRGTGGNTFQKLLKALPKGRFTLDLDLDYFASVDSAPNFKRKAGSDPDWRLGRFKQHRTLLKKRLKNFENMLIALKFHQRVPAVVTIADSTYMTFALDAIAMGQSEYTPIEHTAFISREVRAMLVRVYGRLVLGKRGYIPPETTKTKRGKKTAPSLQKRATSAPKTSQNGKLGSHARKNLTLPTKDRTKSGK